MKADLMGRLNKLPKFKNRPLLPLFEAVVNSIQSIQSDVSRCSKPYVNIKVIRDLEQGVLKKNTGADCKELRSRIVGFEITDNGMGFNDKNFDAFDTIDTTNKIELGGKGIGRLMWLLAFDNVFIESTYRNNNNIFSRKFQFDRIDGVKNSESAQIPDERDVSTTIKLYGYKTEYANSCPIDLEIIASKILEHCFSFFVLDNDPVISISDDKDSIYLNELFDSMRGRKEFHRDGFVLNDTKFSLLHVKSGFKLEPRIHYCAHNREVVNKHISKIIELPAILKDDDGEFSYSLYVQSDYLDEKVTESRDSFTGYNESAPLIGNEIPWNEIESNIRTNIRAHLTDTLDDFEKNKEIEICKYVEQEAPQYRFILNSQPEKVRAISEKKLKPHLLDLELHKIRFESELATKKTVVDLLNQPDNIKSSEQYIEMESRLIENINQESQAALAHYVAHRRIIIKMLEDRMNRQEHGKYSKEEEIHELIIPMRITTDSKKAFDHNLWLVDERLAYHRYIASDTALKATTIIESESNNRPDVVFYGSAALTNEEDAPFQSVTIVELKRPERTDGYDPIKQVTDYIYDIKESKCQTIDGRTIKVLASTKFYCYIICDITNSLARKLEGIGYTKTSDEMGYFSHNSNYNAYIEVVSFDKLLKDAKQRNRILFDKLNV